MSGMNINGLILLLPEKADTERDSVAHAWIAAGGKAEKLGRFWEPPAYDPQLVRLYGNDAFCLVLGQKLGLTLISPPDDLLLSMPEGVVKRKLQVFTLATAAEVPFPYFVKPLVPKQFKAAVYENLDSLKAECQGLEPDTLLMASEIVQFDAEVRAFVLDGEVLDAAIYEGSANLQDALAFAGIAARDANLPETCVLDVGYIPNRGWAVIEANAAWGAGLNGCIAGKVIGAIERAVRA
jgi:hypothetical protein